MAGPCGFNLFPAAPLRTSPAVVSLCPSLSGWWFPSVPSACPPRPGQQMRKVSIIITARVAERRVIHSQASIGQLSQFRSLQTGNSTRLAFFQPYALTSPALPAFILPQNDQGRRRFAFPIYRYLFSVIRVCFCCKLATIHVCSACRNGASVSIAWLFGTVPWNLLLLLMGGRDAEDGRHTLYTHTHSQNLYSESQNPSEADRTMLYGRLALSPQSPARQGVPITASSADGQTRSHHHHTTAPAFRPLPWAYIIVCTY